MRNPAELDQKPAEKEAIMVENGTRENSTEQAVMSMPDFARLGEGQVAYVKQIDSSQARSLFPTLNGLPEGINLYAVVNADGTPLGLTDSRDSAIASAIEYNLEPVSVH